MSSPRYRSPTHKPGWYRARQRAITPAQKRAERALWPLYGLSFSHMNRIDPAAEFGRQQPTVLEIGCGTGEALIELATERPHSNFLGVDWFRSGLATCLQSIDARGLDNVRLVRADAATLLERGLPRKPLFDEVLVLFPDPWYGSPERRIVRRDVLNSLQERMRWGGILHVATDVPGYPQHVRNTVAATGRWKEVSPAAFRRPSTRYERAGLAEGRPIVDLRFAFTPSARIDSDGLRSSSTQEDAVDRHDSRRE